MKIKSFLITVITIVALSACGESDYEEVANEIESIETRTTGGDTSEVPPKKP